MAVHLKDFLFKFCMSRTRGGHSLIRVTRGRRPTLRLLLKAVQQSKLLLRVHMMSHFCAVGRTNDLIFQALAVHETSF